MQQKNGLHYYKSQIPSTKSQTISNYTMSTVRNYDFRHSVEFLTFHYFDIGNCLEFGYCDDLEFYLQLDFMIG